MAKISLAPLTTNMPVVQANPPLVRTYANNDQVIIVWKYDEPIKDCIGFAIYRKLNNESDSEADPLMNRIGFADEQFKKGEQRPSSEWPIQRFVWTDFSVSDGDSVAYKIVPILYDGDRSIKDNVNVSDWTKQIRIRTGINSDGKDSSFHAYFNRGIISSQFYSRMNHDLGNELPGKTINAVIEGENSKLRDFLGGYLDNQLFSLLDEVVNNESLQLYGALYELHQKDLLQKLCKIGNRAEIILANGAAKKKGEDKNSESREEIKKNGVKVYDRIVDVTKKHFAHNKFFVIYEHGVPKRVWTGSTNWTSGGMFSQVNNGLLLKSENVASIYMNEWNALKRDVVETNNNYGVDLYESNKAAFKIGHNKSRVWFAPTQGFKDLEDVEQVMENAKTGILFLMFNPGPKNSFFNYIQDLQNRKSELFIHGVINQDPGSKENPLIFFHRGQKIETDWNAILPKKINEEFAFWFKEVSAGLVTIHSKVLVIDPFGENPFVITGSHNFGPKASSTNDENLLIINDRRLAEEYAVNVLAVYDHYRWRYTLFQKNTNFKGLIKDREWMGDYMEDKLRIKERDFLMG